jgi:hypothetical protein
MTASMDEEAPAMESMRGLDIVVCAPGLLLWTGRCQ